MTPARSGRHARASVLLTAWKPALRPTLTAVAAAALAATALAATALIATPAAAAAGDGSTTDPNITFVGRWDRGSTAAFIPHWTGAYLRTGFTGSTVKLRQRNSVELWVSIDGGEFVNHRNVSGTVDLTPTPLRAGEHTLVVHYRQVAGSYRGDARFLGLILDAGARTYPLPVSPKLVEFVGDSITAGTGSSKLALTAYGWLVGERLGVEHTQIAQGGACLVAAADGCVGLEQRFGNLSAQDDSPTWDFGSYQADAVVVNLGTNDVGHAVSTVAFQESYTRFLRTIRSRYPNAAILALKTFRGRYVPQTEAAVRAVNDAGDLKVFFIDTDGWLSPAGLSDAVHPNDLGHQMIADRLAPIVAARIGSPPAYVKVVNRNSGKVLTVSGGSAADAAPIVQAADTGGASQRWQVVDAGGGYSKLVNRASGKVLDVAGRSTVDGAAVLQYRDTGGANQFWQSIDAGGGYRKLVNRNSGKVLEVTGRSTAEDAAVIQYRDNGGANQQWQLVAG